MITDKMIEAAQDAYMPFGDMGMALMCAFAEMDSTDGFNELEQLADATSDDEARKAIKLLLSKFRIDAAAVNRALAQEVQQRGVLLEECLEFLTQVIAHCDDVDLAGKAEDLRAKLEQ